MSYLSVSEAARRLDAKPRDISDLFYNRVLRDDLCPIVSGRRLIADHYLDMIRAALRRAGKLKPERRRAVAATPALAPA